MFEWEKNVGNGALNLLGCYPASFYGVWPTFPSSGSWTWRWDEQVIPKRRSYTIKQRRVTTQKILCTVTTTAEAFNHTCWKYFAKRFICWAWSVAIQFGIWLRFVRLKCTPWSSCNLCVLKGLWFWWSGVWLSASDCLCKWKLRKRVYFALFYVCHLCEEDTFGATTSVRVCV